MCNVSVHVSVCLSGMHGKTWQALVSRRNRRWLDGKNKWMKRTCGEKEKVNWRWWVWWAGWGEKRNWERRWGRQGDRKDGPLASSFISFLHGEMCVLDASISLSWWNRCAVSFKRHANLSYHNLSGHNTWYIYTGTIYCCLRGDGWRRWGWWAAALSGVTVLWCACMCVQASASLSACLQMCVCLYAHLPVPICACLMYSAAHTCLFIQCKPKATDHNIACKSGFAVCHWYTLLQMSNTLP